MVHIITRRVRVQASSITRIECTCGHIAASETERGAERQHDRHILTVIRENRAADKATG